MIRPTSLQPAECDCEACVDPPGEDNPLDPGALQKRSEGASVVTSAFYLKVRNATPEPLSVRVICAKGTTKAVMGPVVTLVPDRCQKAALAESTSAEMSSAMIRCAPEPLSVCRRVDHVVCDHDHDAAIGILDGKNLDFGGIVTRELQNVCSRRVREHPSEPVAKLNTTVVVAHFAKLGMGVESQW